MDGASPNKRHNSQATDTASDASRLVGNFFIHANPFPGCVPLTFSGCASASVTHQAVTLDYAVMVQIA
ncbi:hypothetical protein [Nostoc sp. UHCC 0870]|uniref:hypothetical protein n=1 Tax=Nostoc sp. UHCC 0870 TaxID=2914041 RepID=UPI0030D9107A